MAVRATIDAGYSADIAVRHDGRRAVTGSERVANGISGRQIPPGPAGSEAPPVAVLMTEPRQSPL